MLSRGPAACLIVGTPAGIREGGHLGCQRGAWWVTDQSGKTTASEAQIFFPNVIEEETCVFLKDLAGD